MMMRRLTRIILSFVLASVFWSGMVHAQGGILQGGPIVPGHGAMWSASGVLQDAGGAGGGALGSTVANMATGGNLALSGGNFSAAAGQILKLMCCSTAGNWVEEYRN